jgi:hypothetical protein
MVREELRRAVALLWLRADIDGGGLLRTHSARASQKTSLFINVAYCFWLSAYPSPGYESFHHPADDPAHPSSPYVMAGARERRPNTEQRQWKNRPIEGHMLLRITLNVVKFAGMQLVKPGA